MLGHPRGLPLLFMTEMWERFSFYGMRVILVLYMVGKTSEGGMGWTEEHALQLYGTYIGLAYLTPLIGGYLADRFLGQRISAMFGGFLMAIGHFLLAFNGTTTFYSGLACIVIGNGFFKPCLTSILGGLYKEGDSRRDGGYSIFYMGINLGSLIGTGLCSWLHVNYGFDYGFIAAGFAMVLGLSIFGFGAKKSLGDIGLRPNKVEATKIQDKPLTHVDKKRILGLTVLIGLCLVFMVAWDQTGGLLILFAQKHTDRLVGGWEIPAGWFYSLNPLTIVLFAPLISLLWSKLGQRKRDLSVGRKFSLGFWLAGISFFLMVLAPNSMSAGSKVNPLWLVGHYFFITITELCILPVLWSAVSKFAPKKYLASLMALALCSIGIGSKIANTIGSYINQWGSQQIFLGLTILMVAFGLITLAIDRWLQAYADLDESIDADAPVTAELEEAKTAM